METDAAEEALRAFGQQSGLAVLVEQYVWYFVVAFALLFVRDSVTNAMVCWIHTNGTRRPARITKTTLFSTSFYLYEVTDGQITGGTLLTVPNSELKSLRIERPLDTLHLPEG